MEISELKNVIAQQKKENDEYTAKQRIIARQVDRHKLKRFLNHPNILVITGPRRAGKSVLARQILEGIRYGYINFDDERLANITTKDLDLVIQSFYELYGSDLEYFIFDEIQNVPHWQLFVSRLRQNKKIIITGSNARLLSGELATHLTGRYYSFTLYPFSFAEFLSWKNVQLGENDWHITESRAQLRTEFSEYLERGGFPEALAVGPTALQQVYGDIIERDILYRHAIRNRAAFKELARQAISSFGCRISFQKFKSALNIKSIITVRNYLDYLETSFLIFTVQKFSFRLKQQTISPRKVYAIDTGLITALAWQFSTNAGARLENAVWLGLLRRRSYRHDVLQEIYYWQNNRGQEVDFVLKQGRQVTQLIQACLEFSRPETREREVSAILSASDELQCDDLLIITDDKEGVENAKGKTIRFVPIWKWLLLS